MRIRESVASLGSYAFEGYSSLINVTIRGKRNSSWGTSVFEDGSGL